MKTFLFLIIVSLSACIVPSAEKIPFTFVSEDETLAIEISREADELFLKGRYAEAELKYRQASYLFPKANNIKINLANSLIRSGQKEESLLLIEELLEKTKEEDFIDILILKAFYHLSFYQYDKSLKTYKVVLDRIDALEDFKESKRYKEVIYNNLSSLNFKIGNEFEAICSAYNAYFQNKSINKKEKIARFQIATGSKNLYSENKDFNNFSNLKMSYHSSYLVHLFMNNDEEAKDYALRIKKLSKYSSSKYPEVELIDYLLNTKESEELEGSEGSVDEEDLEFIESLELDKAPKSSIALYWPIELLDFRLE